LLFFKRAAHPATRRERRHTIFPLFNSGTAGYFLATLAPLPSYLYFRLFNSGTAAARCCPLAHDAVQDRGRITSAIRLPQAVNYRVSFLRWVIIDPPQPLSSVALERQHPILTPCHPFGVILRGDYRHTGLPASSGRCLDAELVELSSHQMIGH
jgi:hypothetical protein